MIETGLPIPETPLLSNPQSVLKGHGSGSNLPFILNYDNLSGPDEELLRRLHSVEVVLDDQSFKLSDYDGPGFALNEDPFPGNLSSDKKWAILRSIISRESKKTNLQFVKKSEGKVKWDKLVKTRIADRVWSGSLSDRQREKRHLCLNCGKYGKEEQDKKGNVRYLPMHCNERDLCAHDNTRYYRGRGIDVGKRFLAIAEANNVKRIHRFRLTLPQHIKDQVKTAKQLTVFERAANKFFQEFYGCPMKGNYLKSDHRYLNGNVGVTIFAHLYSTSESWKRSPHFHAVVCPVKKNGDIAENVEREIRKNDLRDFRKRWSELVKEVSEYLRFEGVEKIPDELVVNTSYDPVGNGLKDQRRFMSHMNYDGRSPVIDLEKAIVGYDLNQEIVVMAFEHGNEGYFVVWKIDEYVDVLMEKMAVKADYKIFGWFLRLKTNAKALGIDLEKVEDDFEAVPELTESVNFKRKYETTFDTEKGRLKKIKRIFVKKCADPDEPEYWKEVDYSQVRGEEVSFAKRKRYLCKTCRVRK